MTTFLPEAEFLKMITKLTSSKKCIEVGVFTGLSSICIAEGLPEDGKLYCYDCSDEYAQLAKKYWKKTGVQDKIVFELGDAYTLMSKLAQDEAHVGTFDFA